MPEDDNDCPGCAIGPLSDIGAPALVYTTEGVPAQRWGKDTHPVQGSFRVLMWGCQSQAFGDGLPLGQGGYRVTITTNAYQA